MDNFIIRESNKSESEQVINEIINYNLSKVPKTQEDDFIYINRVILNSDGKIIGGINSKMYCWNCLYIDVLWINEDYRKQGLGSILLKEVENASKEKGCYLIHLDTFDFQAKDFYIKNGYKVFGTLDECPKGHKRYFMSKVI
ncbi:MAG: GNAT family N-acetyltransferase [Clostridium sp.]|uniref:GNAT family N-acetyltransferase n=1 Tax=Clostridium sp. TaxID=1506 RepID=UPI002FC8DB83